MRLYSYDTEGDRASQTIRKPGVEGECASEGGEVSAHSYDQADRLDDEGVVYEGMGNITSLPAADAGGSALASTYYQDGQLQSQKQAGKTNVYTLDPAGRVLQTETISEKGEVATTISHYAGGGMPSGRGGKKVLGRCSRDGVLVL